MRRTRTCQKERKKKIEKIKLYIYIGESSKSAYEQGYGHPYNYTFLHEDSYMLKHSLDVHGGNVMHKTDSL